MYIPLLSPSYCPAVRILALTAALILPLGALAQPVTPFKGKAGALPGEGLLPERFALVVGINRYDATGTLGLNDLVNAENDAEGVASELKEAGFEQTFVLTTGRKIKATPNGSSYVTKNEILNRLSTLVSYASKSHERTGRPPIILFYFAGHGLNLDSEDYILPSDFKPSSAEDVRTMGISIMEIVARLSWAKPALRIVISDACRTRSPGTLVRLSKDGETVSLAPGNGNTRIVELGKPPRGTNDLFLAFATLADETAADAGEKGEHGKFAGAFIEAMRGARERARIAGADGHESGASEILHETRQRMALDTSSVQGSEFVDRAATSFVFHPTQAAFDLEESVWARAQRNTALETNAEAIRKALYCNFKAFILQTSYYSYFGAAALDQIHRYEGGAIDCPSAELKTTASESNEVKFLKPLQGGWVAKVPETSRTPDVALGPEDRRSWLERTLNVASGRRMHEDRLAGGVIRDQVRLAASSSGLILAQSVTAQPKKADDLKIKDLAALELDPQALAEVARFDPEARVDDLAVASAGLGLFSDTRLTKRIAGVRAGDLLQVLRIVDQDTINVRVAQPAANGSATGFVNQHPVDSGRVAVRFRAVVHLIPGSVQYDTKVVDPILRSSVLTDMQVRFPSQDKLTGFARAQIAADKFGKLSAIAGRTVLRFVPSILPSTNKKEEVEDSVWVIMTLLPLSRDVRLRLLSSSGLSVRPEDAFDLAGFAEQSASVTLKGAEALSPACTAAAGESLRSMKRKVTAFVQFMPDKQRSDSEQIRSVLNAGGFYTPAAEKVIVVPQASEIRMCAGQDKSAAALARDLLEKCELGRFTPRETSTCRKGAPRDTIEIVLGPNAPG